MVPVQPWNRVMLNVPTSFITDIWTGYFKSLFLLNVILEKLLCEANTRDLENWPNLAQGSDFVTTEQHEHGFFVIGRLLEDFFCADGKTVLEKYHLNYQGRYRN